MLQSDLSDADNALGAKRKLAWNTRCHASEAQTIAASYLVEIYIKNVYQ